MYIYNDETQKKDNNMLTRGFIYIIIHSFMNLITCSIRVALLKI